MESTPEDPCDCGATAGHYLVRVTVNRTRPILHLDPSPKSPDREAWALAECPAIVAALRRTGEGAAPKRWTARRKAKGSTEDTVSQWFVRWLDQRDAAGLASVSDDRGRFRTHVEPEIGALAMVRVTKRDLEELVEALDAKVRAGRISWKTAANAWTLTSKAFSDAHASKSLALRVLRENPAAGVRGPDRGDKRAKGHLYPSEFLAILESPDVSREWKRTIAVATCIYVRAAELRALEWTDVDVERGIVHVHRSEDRNEKSKPTKTGITRRFAIEPVLLPLLRAMHAETQGEGRVVTIPDDRHLARGLRGVLRAAGVARAELFANDATRKPMTFHDLRATGITWMAVRGDDPLKIMQRAGHTDFKTTQGYIREAEAIRDGFGEVFPPLPEALGTAPPRGGSGSGGSRVSPRVLPQVGQVVDITVEAPGIEPALNATIGQKTSSIRDRGSATIATESDAKYADRGSPVALRGETIGLDLDRAVRLADALSALVTDPLARPVVDELRRVLEAGRGHSAPILDINAERAKRGPTR